MRGTSPSHAVRIGTAIAALVAVGIIVVGTRYLLDPQGSAATFGVPSWPHGPDAAFLSVKGVRDIVSGLVVLDVMATGSRRALGWVLLAAAVTPFGDMLIVLTSGGLPATAFGVHGATAAVVALAGILVLRGAMARRA